MNIKACLTALLLFSPFASAAEQAPDTVDKDYSSELPRIDPLEPQAALKQIQVRPGYAIQQTAAEPLVADPVAMAFDEDGKLYVIEMRDYSEQDTENLGRVRLLEDTNQDGTFDKSTIYAEGLSWPTAILCYDGGVFVGAPPLLMYLKDTNGDNKADVKKVVFNGFGRSNVQGLMNSFRWGLDNRIHGATSASGAIAKRPDVPNDAGVNLQGRDFSFDPNKLDIRPESGGGQHGMCFDDWGRKFVCSNSRHIQFVAYEDRYIARNPRLAAPSPRIDIALDGTNAPVYRSSPVEPWRIVRTRLRATGVVPGAVEWGGKAAGYFTAATGITIYRGDQFPADMRGTAIIGDVGSNIVHRKELTPEGISFVATRIDPESEFVRSTDIWFRPVQFANAPDGCLHLLDMYREVIEHPKSLPPQVKQHLDLTSGRERGRLYRVVPENSTYRPTPKLSQMASAELVKLLSHRNAWHRETASRLLFQRQDKSLVPDLKQLAITGKEPLGRLHALAVLDGLGGIDEEVVVSVLRDSHPRIRERALRYAERFVNSPKIIAAIKPLTDDEDLRVRYQLAFTAGEFSGPEKTEWLSHLLQTDGVNPWMQLAMGSSLKTGSLELFSRVLNDPEVRKSPQQLPHLKWLVLQIARENQTADLEKMLQLLDSLPPADAALKDQLLVTLLTSAGKPAVNKLFTGSRANVLNDLLTRARKTLDSDGTQSERLAAIGVLKLSSDSADVSRLLKVLNPAERKEIQSAALVSLATLSSASVADGLLDRWPQLSPEIRREAEEVLFSRPDWAAATLSRIESGKLPPAEISSSRLQALTLGKNADLKKRSDALLKSQGTASRADVVERYQPVLNLAGDVDRGRIVFRKQCAGCHRLENTGHETGPNLAAIKNRGKAAILLNVLDPNREVNPAYLNYVVAMTDGRTQTGIIKSETATSLTLIRADNQSSDILRKDIEQIRSSGLSLMPEGLEKTLDEQSMADLLTYLLDDATK